MSKDFKAPEGLPRLSLRRHSKESLELGPPERVVVSNAKHKELQQMIHRIISKVYDDHVLPQGDCASAGATKAAESCTTSTTDGSKQRSSLGKQSSEEEVEGLVQAIEKRCRLKAQKDVGSSLASLKVSHPVLLHFLAKNKSNNSLLDLFVEQLLAAIGRHAMAAQPEISTATITEASENVFNLWSEVVAVI